MSRVILFSRPGCHLCRQAREVVADVTTGLGVGFVEQDITSDPQWHDEYWDKIPVILVDGRELARYRVDADVLRAALAGGSPDDAPSVG